MIKIGNIYESIWTGGVDEILGFENEYIIVKDVVLGKERRHMTSLECNKLSTIPVYNANLAGKHTKENLDAIVIFLTKGMPAHCFSGLHEYRKYAQINKLVEKSLRYYF